MISFLDKVQLRKTILSPNSSIKEAIRSLEKSKSQIILIANNKKRLISTLTDGDIRRSILKGIKLDTKISNIENSKPHYVNVGTQPGLIYELMKQKQIKSVPILDKNMKIIGLCTLGKISRNPKSKKIKKIDNIFFILAGGKGRRLRPLTKNIPKPLLAISGKPILEHIILKAKQEGFHNFYISINYLGKKIKEYFKDGSKYGVSISYVEEKKLLGTAGSLKYLEKKTGLPVIVTNGDLVTSVNISDFLNFHNKRKPEASMAMRVFEYHSPYGVIETRGYKIKKITEKRVSSHKINAGIYILNPSVLKYIKSNEKIDMTDLFNKIKNKIVYPIFEDWVDIGQKKDYEEVKLKFK